MKKRQKPTALLVLLGTAVLVAFGYNLAQNGLLKTGGPNDRQVLNDAPAETAPIKSTDIATQVSKTATKKPEPTAEEESGQPSIGRGEKPGDPPVILTAKMTREQMKPKPNESSTSTQWYDQTSLNGNR